MMNNANTTNNKSVLILGATGGFGSALTTQMAASGWQVRALRRRAIEQPEDDVESANASAKESTNNNVDWFVGNLDDPSSLVSAAAGVDLIVHSINVPYPQWDPLMVNYTRTIIDLARDNQAHLLFVGNIYNAGIPEDGVINEHTAHAPLNDKGEIRARLEDMIEAASRSGVGTTIMRFGDFFGPGIPSDNWFDICTKSILKSKLSMAGSPEMPHTWAYLPDAVAATERVATIRVATEAQATSSTVAPELPTHMVLPFAGHVFSFSQLKTVIEDLTGNIVKASPLPWTLFKLLGYVWPKMKDVVAMRYLWNHDIQMDGSALAELLGSQPAHTPLAQAVLATVPELASEKKSDRKAALA